MKCFFLIAAFVISLCGILHGQDVPDSLRLARIRTELAELAERDDTFNDEVDISTGQIPLAELLRNIAKVSRVSISVQGTEEVSVSSNFSRARISDLIYFLCKENNLDIEVVGNIVAIHPVVVRQPAAPIPEISYALSSRTLSYDLNGSKLIDVVKRITALTGANIIVPKNLYPRQVAGFVDSMPLDDAIRTLMVVNGMEAAKAQDGVWEITAPYDSVGDPVQQQQRPRYVSRRSFSENELTVDSLGLVTAQIYGGNVQDIITELCEQQGLNYYFVSPLQHEVAIAVRSVGFETFLAVLLEGTQFTWYRENGVYIFGSAESEKGMSSVRIIPLGSRSVNKVDSLIPEALKPGVQVKRFADLNSIIASGDQKAVSRIETFVRSIDTRVPQVTIEVMIVDATKRSLQEAGIDMGIGESPVKKTTGSLSPGIDMTLTSASVNKLINSFNGFGSVNLGRVSSDFYMSLKLLEDNGFIELRSTPKLSTLNGHEATLTSGQTEYYKEETSTWIGSGSNNPMQDKSYVWKSVDANLDIKITPFISLDNHITLDIEIEQTQFTTRVEKDAPPGTTTRSFKSLIRVQDGEMVLLGGIDRNEHEKSSSGLPFIARVPVFKWLFGSSTNNKNEHKLNVFIKPTIIE